MPDIWALASVLAKALLYFGLLTSTGLVLVRFVFAGHVARVLPDMRRVAMLCAGLAVVAALAGFTLRGAALTGDISGLVDAEMLGLMWQTPVGTALVYRVAGLGLVLLGLWWGGAGWAIAGLGGLVSLWSFATIGHLSDASAPWAKPVLVAHLLAVSFWIGILLPLKRLIDAPDGTETASRLGHRFGQLATGVIAALIAAGVLLGVTLVGSWANLLGTAYGLTLLAKLGAVAVLLGLGAWNKVRLVPGLAEARPGAAMHLSKVLQLDWLIFAITFLATAALTTLVAVPAGH